MIFGLLLFLAIASANPAPSAPEQLVAQIKAAYAEVEAENAKLPPPANISEKLIRLGKLDQAGRMAYMKLDLSTLPEADRASVQHQIFAEIGRHDLRYQNELKTLMPSEGWFRLSVYGKEAARAAFLIVQHAVNDQELMRNTLVRLEKLVAEVKRKDRPMRCSMIAPLWNLTIDPSDMARRSNASPGNGNRTNLRTRLTSMSGANRSA